MKYLLIFVFAVSFSVVSGQVKQDSLGIAKDTLKPAPPVVNYLKRQAYQIIIPKGWKIMNDCVDKNCSLLSLPDTLGGGYDKFTENINIVFENLPKNYTVDQYAEYSRTYLPKVVKGFKVHEKKKLKPNVAVMVYSGEKSNFAQKWKQYYYVKNQKVYIITFAAETHKYDYFLPLVTEALASFKVL